MTGTLFLAGAAGLWRAGDRAPSARVEQALVGAAGAGLIGSAVFTTDPVSGYPPGTPDALVRPTRTGMAHTLAAVPVFVGLSAAALTCSWQSFRAGQRGFGLYCAATATAMLATMALAADDQESTGPHAPLRDRRSRSDPRLAHRRARQHRLGRAAR